jgi:hypothetical protein
MTTGDILVSHGFLEKWANSFAMSTPGYGIR